MGQIFSEINGKLGEWIEQQNLFFVATAPLAADGHVNCSPKGMDTFRILDPHRVAYLDLTGSGAETIAHVRENGRIVFMFCAFEGPPNIVRLHGTARVITPDAPEWSETLAEFSEQSGVRTIITADISRISDSCGFAVPKLDYVEERDALTRWAKTKGDAQLVEYRQEKNAVSIDGLNAFVVDD